MQRIFKGFGLVSLVVSMWACSLQKTAVDMTGDISYKASNEFETETNWTYFKEALPGNLKMLEGLYYLEPDNQSILRGLTKGFSAYAFSVGETLSWAEKYQTNENFHEWKDVSIDAYNKSIYYGLAFLKKYDLDMSQLQKSYRESPQKMSQLLSNRLGQSFENVELIFFFAESYGSLINAQKNNPVLIGQLGMIKGLFDWACGIKPDLNAGACKAFYGMYETSRPKMFGGDPIKGKQYFEEGIAQYADNYLLRVLYAQFYLIPMEDRSGYLEQKQFLNQAFEKQQKSWGTEAILDGQYPRRNSINFFNALAKKRWELIEKFESSYF